LEISIEESPIKTTGMSILDHQSQSSNQWLNLQLLPKVFHLPQRFLP
jgi:hypothetical protein